MTAETMAEVLAEHQWYDATSDNEDPATGCTGCDDWFGSEDALDDGTFAAHQAAALSAAGFGLVADAKAEALEEAADVIESMRPEMGPGINITQYRDGRNDAFVRAADVCTARAAALRAVS